MRTFNLCGLGNALVDILLELDEAAFAALGFDRGTMRLVEHAERPSDALLCCAVPVCRRSVLAWREALLGLAERLEQPVPLAPCGVARALVLLTDGGGPFYDARAQRSIGEAVWWIVDGLQP